jgi:hypothetical protein
MISGSCNLNNVSDKELIAIVQAKDASSGTLFINQINPAGPGFNVVVMWNDEAGFRNLATLLHTLVGLGG